MPLLYQTVSATTTDELDKKVTAMLKEGWGCIGGIAIAEPSAFAVGAIEEIRRGMTGEMITYTNQLIYFQTMLKNGHKPPETGVW